MVHRLMSFHDRDSDLSRLNASIAGNPVEVHPYTYEVLRQALEFSACSGGCFDVTIGTELVEWNLLPRPAQPAQLPHGSWKDVELLSGNRVVCHRPLWVDLGGIAKGFAVDQATKCLHRLGASGTVVNAGGDIRVQGEVAEPILLTAESSDGRMPVLELTNGSVASSSGLLRRSWHGGHLYGPHVDGVHRTPASTDRFVCVIAEECVVADALTKIVMMRAAESEPILRRYGASAYVHDPGQAWQFVPAKGAIAE